MEQMKKVIKRLMNIISQPVMRILPGQLAFFLVLSIIPLVILIGAIASLYGLSIDSVLDLFKANIPEDVSNLLGNLLNGEGFDFNVGFFMITGFIIASNGPHSIIVASDTLYGFEHDNYLKRRIKAFFMTVLMVVLFFFIITVVAFGNLIMKWLLSFALLKQIGEQIYFIFILLKWPVAFLLIFFVIKILYTVAPTKTVASKMVNRGALFTMLGWSLATAIYSYYVAHFARYNVFYGALSSIVVLMIWVYILAYTLVIGIAVNANYYEMVETNKSKLESKVQTTSE